MSSTTENSRIPGLTPLWTGYIVELVLCWGMLFASASVAQAGMETNRHDKSGFLLRSSPWGYVFSTTVNQEPVNWSQSPSVILLHGYPLKQGTNDVRVIVTFPPQTLRMDGPESLNGAHWIGFTSLVFENNEWVVSDHVLKELSSVSHYNWKTSPYIQRLFPREDVAFDELQGSKQAAEHECQRMTMQLLDLFRSRNSNKLLKALGLSSGTNAMGVVNEEVTRISEFMTGAISPTCITNVTQLEAVTGSSLVLVHPPISLHLLQVSHRDKESVSIDSFLFGRSAGRWYILGNGGIWLQMNLDGN